MGTEGAADRYLVLILGFLLILIGVLSRLFSLEVYRRISASPWRSVTPSMLPGTPWFRVASEGAALRVIWQSMLRALEVAGMALGLVGVLA